MRSWNTDTATGMNDTDLRQGQTTVDLWAAHLRILNGYEDRTS